LIGVLASSCGSRYVYERASDGVSANEPLRLVSDGRSHARIEGYLTTPVSQVQLWYRLLGPADEPVVALINGSDFASHYWAPELLESLLAGGFRVLTYDQRDSGRSEYLPYPAGFRPRKFEAGDPPPYPLESLRDDLTGLLTALGIERAHLMGVSMGGMVAQLMALQHPHRVLSLSLLSTSPSNSFDPDIDNPDPEFLATVGNLMKKAAIRYYTSSGDRWMDPMVQAMQTITAASDGGADFRRFLEEGRDFGSFNFKSSQGFAVASSPSRIHELSRIGAPTLILHGSSDPWFRYAHAERLRELIPNSRLIAVEGQGHALPRTMFNPHLGAIVEHLRGVP
jgi:pimeloyl-ACP methyl ester carboxylesterase